MAGFRRFRQHCYALFRKNVDLQKRRLFQNASLILVPLIICGLLVLLQKIINNALTGSDNLKCGCKCLECCDWLPPDPNNATSDGEPVWTCYNATDLRPCSPYADCTQRNNSQCGLQYSSYTQAPFCEIYAPPTWSPFTEVPLEVYRPEKLRSAVPEDAEGLAIPADAAWLLYTGEDRELAEVLQNKSFYMAQPVYQSALQGSAQLQALAAGDPSLGAQGLGGIVNSPNFQEYYSNFTEAQAQFFSRMGAYLGTASINSLTLLVEPAYIGAANSFGSDITARASVQPPNDTSVSFPIYFMDMDCSALSPLDQAALGQINNLFKNVSGVGFTCATMESIYRTPVPTLQEEIYCGWWSSSCVWRNGTAVTAPYTTVFGDDAQQQFPSMIYDWKDTNQTHLDLDISYNSSAIINGEGGEGGPPRVERLNGPLNRATNAFLRLIAGNDYEVRLVGVRDMPIKPLPLELDFSSLLGPLFFVWLVHMLLPVFVGQMAGEREEGLRVMMKLQGLSDSSYYFVTYFWNFTLYVLFMIVFAAGGTALGLKVFTTNNWGIQILSYFVWGNTLVAWAFLVSSTSTLNTRWTLMSLIAMIFVSGFVATWVLRQLIEQGPAWVAMLLEYLHPTFAIYRVFYELSAWAFLAARTGTSGMEWSDMWTNGSGIPIALIFLAVNWPFYMFWAYYFDRRRLGWDTMSGKGLSKRFTEARRRRDMKHVSDGKSDTSDSSGAASSTPSSNGKGAVPVTPTPVPQESKGHNYSFGTLLAKVKLKGGSHHGNSSTPAASVVTVVTMPDGGGGGAGSAGAKPVSEIIASLSLPRGAKSDNSAWEPKPPPEWEPKLDAEVGSDLAVDVGAVDPAALKAAPPSEPDDVVFEADRVRTLAAGGIYHLGNNREEMAEDNPILVEGLYKVYPARGNENPKVAVKGITFGVRRSECFGLLGPNGAGKTTALRMITGFHNATQGSVTIAGLKVPDQLDKIYSIMGTCPQHDCIWTGMTAREHLNFYGRLKGLSGVALRDRVIESLRAVNLLSNGAADKVAGSYSGGMKRRLSVACSLIGDPSILFLDEPSTGLDPASRRLLWDAIKKAKRSAAIVLTTHSMEEAENLCDRIAIMVGGQIRCIGSPLDLTSRLGGYHLLNITAAPEQASDVERFVRLLCPEAVQVYALGGTAKYEVRSDHSTLKELFRSIDAAKRNGDLAIMDWSISRAKLEDVFVKMTEEAVDINAA